MRRRSPTTPGRSKRWRASSPAKRRWSRERRRRATSCRRCSSASRTWSDRSRVPGHPRPSTCRRDQRASTECSPGATDRRRTSPRSPGRAQPRCSSRPALSACDSSRCSRSSPTAVASASPRPRRRCRAPAASPRRRPCIRWRRRSVAVVADSATTPAPGKRATQPMSFVIAAPGRHAAARRSTTRSTRSAARRAESAAAGVAIAALPLICRAAALHRTVARSPAARHATGANGWPGPAPSVRSWSPPRRSLLALAAAACVCRPPPSPRAGAGRVSRWSRCGRGVVVVAPMATAFDVDRPCAVRRRACRRWAWPLAAMVVGLASCCAPRITARVARQLAVSAVPGRTERPAATRRAC